MDELVPADPADVEFAIGFALKHDLQRRGHPVTKGMSDLHTPYGLSASVDRVVKHLSRSNYVIMRRVISPSDYVFNPVQRGPAD